MCREFAVSAQRALEPDTTIEVKQEAKNLWASQVNAFSSEFSNANWSANNVLGGTKNFPTYGDNVNAW